MIAFISGHLDLTEDEFKTYYIPLIEAAIKNGHHFVVGDARGCDFMAMKYIYNRSMVERLTIYNMFHTPRHYVEGAWKRTGFQSDSERDSAMTKDSTYDIAWVRPGKEKSGTQKNIDRRSVANKWDSVFSNDSSNLHNTKAMLIEPQQNTHFIK